MPLVYRILWDGCEYESRSFGHFNDDGKEFIITEPFAAPRAQINFLWNDTLISGLNQFGTGEGVFNNQTLMYNHPNGRVRLIRDGHRLFYLRDNDTGEFWNTGLYPVHTAGAKLRTHVGLSYSRFETDYAGIISDSRVFLAPDEPVEIWEFTLRNTSNRARKLWLCPFIDWLLAGYPIFASIYSYLRTEFDSRRKVVSSYNIADGRPHERYNAFVATDGNVVQWCGGKRDFLGPYGTVSRPQSLVEGRMSCKESWCDELAGAMAIDVQLDANEEEKITVLLGSFDTEAEKNRLIAKVLPSTYRTAAWEQIKQEKQPMLDAVRIETPDAQINRLVNIWSKQQIQLCVEFGRDGARGFRDTLQDAWGIAPFNATLAKAKIKETIAHQYSVSCRCQIQGYHGPEIVLI